MGPVRKTSLRLLRPHLSSPRSVDSLVKTRESRRVQVSRKVRTREREKAPDDGRKIGGTPRARAAPSNEDT